MEPKRRASRPSVRGYFAPADAGRGLLEWDVAERQLVAARNYWLATASSAGAPHAMPVWGVWLESRFLFSTGPSTRKARNLRENPRAVVHLESGAQVVAVEGRARESRDEAVIATFLAAYNPKYAWNFDAGDLASGGLFEIFPDRAFAWLADQGEGFSEAATRWIFERAEPT